jgi:hypothetical protein
VNGPSLALLICTRDRSGKIRRCLESLPAAEIRRRGVEVIVVDNASRDDTPQVLDSFARHAEFSFRHLREDHPGKSYALNTGLEHCHADLIAFTDDDCFLAEDYFQAVLGAFRDGSIQYASGRILPYDTSDSNIAVNASTRPKVFPPGSFLPTGTFQGGNMVIARQVFERVGHFDITLGPSTRYRCEDIEIVARAAVGGFTGAYLPDLVVYHHYGHKRGRESAQRERDNAFGRGAYYVRFISAGHWPYLAGWLRRAARSWRVDHTICELRGAWDYWRSQVHRGG